MGKEAHSGPVYGAKSLLWSSRIEALSTNASGVSGVVVAATIVPTYEDWYITEFAGHRSGAGSTSLVMKLVDDSTVMNTLTFNSSLVDQNICQTVTATPGEYEGLWVAGGSTLTVTYDCSSATIASTGVSFSARGFIRWINSTRPE